MTTIGLVACSKTKLDHSAAARELYTSPLFKAAADYCDRTYDRWFILSAQHGVLGQYAHTAPYDQTLSRMSVDARLGWAERILEELGGLDIGLSDRLYIHAGRPYRIWVPGWYGCPVEVPIAGLAIGQQLRWYAERRPT